MESKCGPFRNNLINPFAYWVVPGKVAAGEYPGEQFLWNPKVFLATLIHSFRALWSSRFKFWNSSDTKIDSLLSNGINVFVDLTEEGERPSYLAKLHKNRRRRSISTKYFRFPIRDRSVPDPKFIDEIIRIIRLEICQGNVVYIHCFRGLGRTGILVGCYLKEIKNFELDNDMNIVDYLKMFRSGVAGDFRNSPETEEQVQFMIDWKPNL
ncbi:MAG: hypothetical protein CMM30_09685 [Rhodospirillaceae bacterium]|nr:hypothetical protein [Rhodospirillaceae bacterium]|tara:strand:+ start:2928 stop:3557 length:630 start_codon:yes stop_codon:yes gene_type:complete